MSQTVKKEVFGATRRGEQALLFRIPNNTNDYIEVTNYGCTIRGIYVHNTKGALENVVCGLEGLADYEASNPGAIFGGTLGAALAHKVWDVADTGDNYVFFVSQCSAEESGCGSAVKVGARIMWVNLNRLVLDLFVTPQNETAMTLGTQLAVGGRNGAALQVRSFCPQTARPDGTLCPVEESRYAGMVFTDAASMTDVFVSPSEEIKPMAELADPGAGLYLSAYTTLSSLRLEPCGASGGIRLIQETREPVVLRSGESFTGRAIYGVDYLRPQSPEDDEEANPMGAFLTGL